MASLYELADEFKQLASMDDAGDDEFRAALDETLTAQGEMLEDKLEAYAVIIRQFEGQASVIGDEIKRLTARQQSVVSKVNHLKDRMREAMLAADLRKVQRPLFTITRIAGRDAVEIENEAFVPRDYVRVKQVEQIDKKALLDALKSGKAIPGAKLGKTKDSLRIS